MPITSEVTQFESWITILKKLDHWVVSLPNIVLAAIVFTLFIFAVRFSRNFLRKVLSKATQPSVSNLFAALSYILILSIGLFIALSILQLNKAGSSLLAGAGIIGLTMGFTL